MLEETSLEQRLIGDVFVEEAVASSGLEERGRGLGAGQGAPPDEKFTEALTGPVGRGEEKSPSAKQELDDALRFLSRLEPKDPCARTRVERRDNGQHVPWAGLGKSVDFQLGHGSPPTSRIPSKYISGRRNVIKTVVVYT